MKLYSLNPYLHNEQTLKKYCADLDRQITALQNYIDFAMPNYIGLNNTSPQFFKQTDLITLGILDANETTIYPDKMHAGQIIHQNWTLDTLNIDGEDSAIIPQGLPNGWALIKHAAYYEKVSLASSGDFYVLVKVECLETDDPDDPTGIFKTTWRFEQNAASTFGSNYTFSLLPINSRFIYYNIEPSWNTNKTKFHPDSWAHMSIPNWFKRDNQIELQIITKTPTPWDSTYVLGHEIFFDLDDTVDICEEVFCDDTHNYEQQVFEKRSLSFYNINTNIDINNSHFYVYFY